MRLIRVVPRLLLGVFGVLIGGIVLVAAVLILWMSLGPLPLDSLTPVLESALQPQDGSVQLHLGRAEMELTHHGTKLLFLVKDLRIEDRNRANLARIPAINLTLAVKPLFAGRLEPTEIALLGATVHVARDQDGKASVVFGQGSAGTEPGKSLVSEILASQPGGSRPERRNWWSSLRHLLVRDLSLEFEDKASGAVHRLRHVTAGLDRTEQGINAEVTLALDSGGTAHAVLAYTAATGSLVTRATLHDWQLAELGDLVPETAPLAALRLPLNGNLRVAIDLPTRRLAEAQADLVAGAGEIAHPDLPSGSVTIAGAQLAARYQATEARFDLDKLAVDLGGPTLLLTGSVGGLSEALLRGGAQAAASLPVSLQLDVQNMPTDALARYWPAGLAAGAHDWVTANIHDGMIEDTQLATNLVATVAPGAAAPSIDRLDSFGGTMRMRGLTVDYKHPLPPVLGVDGTASFDQSKMVLLPSSGTLEGIQLKGGKIVITGLDKKDQDIDIGLDIDGPLHDALDVLDSKPLRYGQRIGLDPAQVEGGAQAHLTFKFPLEKDLSFDLIQIGTTAALNGVVLRKIVAGRDLTEGDLQLSLDNKQIAIDGTAKLADVPAKVAWSENFSKKEAVRSRYAVSGILDDQARDRLGLSPPSLVALSGPVAVSASVEERSDSRGTAALQLDLGQAELGFPDLGWTKPAGQAATAKIDLDMSGGRIAAIRRAALNGRDADIGLSAMMAADQVLERIDFQRVHLGATDVAGSVARRPEGGWRIDLAGPAFDASALFAQISQPTKEKTEQPPLVISGKFDRVVFGPQREARRVALQLFSDGVHWQSAYIDLAPFGQGSLRLSFGPVGGQRPFVVTTSDLGASLRLLDISKHVTGGQLTVLGEAKDQGAGRVFVGRLDGRDYRVVKAPILAKLLSLASFGGIAGLLTGNGIPFTRISADFSVQDGLITVTEGRTYGGAIGLNTGGIVDLDKNRIDLSGTLVPAYTLNSILGNIPVLGDLLQGGKGQGLFAASFHVSGALDDPDVSVNPLTALAPGFLRNLFLFEPSPKRP